MVNFVLIQNCLSITYKALGIGYSFGMFMEPLKSEMGESNAEVASVGSLQVSDLLLMWITQQSPIADRGVPDYRPPRLQTD